MLIPEIDDVEPALNQAEQDVVDRLYQLLDAAAIGSWMQMLGLGLF